jgi:hypothetical protein
MVVIVESALAGDVTEALSQINGFGLIVFVFVVKQVTQTRNRYVFAMALLSNKKSESNKKSSSRRALTT